MVNEKFTTSEVYFSIRRFHIFKVQFNVRIKIEKYIQQFFSITLISI